MTSRRAFLARIAAGSAGVPLRPPRADSQGLPSPRGARGGTQMRDTVVVRDSTNLFAMDQNAARTVSRPAKPGAVAVLSDLQRDDLEHGIRCQCGCTLDVFTCRTTDFSCQVSPAMHRDVMGLVRGGYSAQEIIDAFVESYGERVLMAPKKSGFNLLAWLTPAIAVIAGGAIVALWLRRWGRKNDSIEPTSGRTSRATSGLDGLNATPDELARLDAAVRGDDTA